MSDYPSLRDQNNVPIPMDWRLAYAEAQIFDTYGDTVSVVKKKKPLRKFGTNAVVGTSRATVMTLPTGITAETLLTEDTAIADGASTPITGGLAGFLAQVIT